MAYCTNTNVQNETKGLDYASSGAAITSIKVDEFISQADAYIDSRIGLKYSTPVTATESLKILKQISTWLVVDRVKDILTTRTGNAQRDQTSEPVVTPGTKAERMLKDIVAGNILLSDATLRSSSDGVHSFTYDEGEEHTFEKGVDQW